MKRIIVYAILMLLCLMAMGQQPAHFSWRAYGIGFDGPKTMAVEDDSEDAYVVSNEDFYITLQALDAEGIHQEELPEILADYVEDDPIDKMEKPVKFETWQFYGVSVSGQCEQDRCRSVVLMAKDGSCAFYVSVVYASARTAEVQPLIESFTLEEE